MRTNRIVFKIYLEKNNFILSAVSLPTKTIMKQIIQRFSYAAWAFFFLVSLMGQVAVDAQTPKQDSNNFIMAGKSVGKIKIGDTKDQVFKLYPKLKRGDYSQTKECPVVQMELPNAVRANFQNGRVSYLLVDANYGGIMLETAEKIKSGSTPQMVKKYYPKASKAFTKLSYTFTSTGYAPLLYWVDFDSGIAFEFYTDSTKGRLVNKIHIFAPNGKMLFGGNSCDEDDEDLRELPPFAIKVPEKMIKDYDDKFNH